MAATPDKHPRERPEGDQDRNHILLCDPALCVIPAAMPQWLSGSEGRARRLALLLGGGKVTVFGTCNLPQLPFISVLAGWNSSSLV